MKVLQFLKGKKTYILGGLMFLIALENYLTGSSTLSQFMDSTSALIGFNGLGLMTLRAGIAKIQG